MRPLNKAVFDDLKYDNMKVLARCIADCSRDRIWNGILNDMQTEFASIRFDDTVWIQIWNDFPRPDWLK